MTEWVITPRVALDSEVRRTIQVTQEDVDLLKAHDRRPGWTMVVTDVQDGNRYYLGSAPCSLPECYCDAVIIKELGRE